MSNNNNHQKSSTCQGCNICLQKKQRLEHTSQAAGSQKSSQRSNYSREIQHPKYQFPTNSQTGSYVPISNNTPSSSSVNPTYYPYNNQNQNLVSLLQSSPNNNLPVFNNHNFNSDAQKLNYKDQSLKIDSYQISNNQQSKTPKQKNLKRKKNTSDIFPGGKNLNNNTDNTYRSFESNKNNYTYSNYNPSFSYPNVSFSNYGNVNPQPNMNNHNAYPPINTNQFNYDYQQSQPFMHNNSNFYPFVEPPKVGFNYFNSNTNLDDLNINEIIDSSTSNCQELNNINNTNNSNRSQQNITIQPQSIEINRSDSYKNDEIINLDECLEVSNQPSNNLADNTYIGNSTINSNILTVDNNNETAPNADDYIYEFNLDYFNDLEAENTFNCIVGRDFNPTILANKIAEEYKKYESSRLDNPNNQLLPNNSGYIEVPSSIPSTSNTINFNNTENNSSKTAVNNSTPNYWNNPPLLYQQSNEKNYEPKKESSAVKLPHFTEIKNNVNSYGPSIVNTTNQLEKYQEKKSKLTGNNRADDVNYKPFVKKRNLGVNPFTNNSAQLQRLPSDNEKNVQQNSTIWENHPDIIELRKSVPSKFKSIIVNNLLSFSAPHVDQTLSKTSTYTIQLPLKCPISHIVRSLKNTFNNVL